MMALSFILLFASIWWVYFPSIHHMPRSDEWCLLLEIIDCDNFLCVWKNLYSFTRTTKIFQATDALLFRPIGNIFTGIKRLLFEGNLAYYQAASILLHILVVWVMFYFMARVLAKPYRHKSDVNFSILLSFLFSLFFAVNFSGMEMVIWAHISCYLFFILLFLAALICGLKSIRQAPGALKQRYFLFVAWFFTLLAAFTYELGPFLAVLMGTMLAVYSYWENKDAKKALFYLYVFLSITVFYLSVNTLDFLAHQHIKKDVTSLSAIILDILNIKTAHNLCRIIKFTLYQPFFPWYAQIYYNNAVRLNIFEEFSANYRVFNSLSIFSITIFCGWLSLTIFGLCLCLRRPKRIQVLLSGLLICILIFYWGAIIFGRMNVKIDDVFILSAQSYYSYFSFLLFTLISFIGWQELLFYNIPKIRTVFKCAMIYVCIGMCVIAVYSGIRVNKVNKSITNDYLVDARNAIIKINNFVKKHKSEKDFSIAVDLNVSTSMIIRPYGVPVSTIFFRKYEDNFNPKYVLMFKNKDLIAQTLQEYRDSHPLAQRQLVPKFKSLNHIENESYCVIFYWEGSYYGYLYLHNYANIYPWYAVGNGPEEVKELTRGIYLKSKEMIKVK